MSRVIGVAGPLVEAPRLKRTGPAADGAAMSERALLAAVLLLALGARLAVCFAAGQPWLTPDSQSYLRMAEAIAAGRPISAFPNGYPLLIAAAGGRVSLLLAINALASTATVWLTYLLARQLTGHAWPALAAALAAALYPNQLVYVHYVLTEPVATLCLTGGLVLLCRARASAAGALLALACTLRTSLLPVLPLAGALLAWRSPERSAWRRFAAGAAALGAAYATLLGAGVVAPSSNTGANLLLAVGSPSTSLSYSYDGFDAEQRRRPLATYARFAVRHPGRFARQRASALWELWGPYPTEAGRSLPARLLLGLRLPLLALALAAVVSHRRRLEVWLLASPAAALTAVHVATFATPRFTVVAEPALLALASLSLWDRCGPGRRADRESSGR
jgi:hypothetical protein